MELRELRGDEMTAPTLAQMREAVQKAARVFAYNPLQNCSAILALDAAAEIIRQVEAGELVPVGQPTMRKCDHEFVPDSMGRKPFCRYCGETV